MESAARGRVYDFSELADDNPNCLFGFNLANSEKS